MCFFTYLEFQRWSINGATGQETPGYCHISDGRQEDRDPVPLLVTEVCLDVTWDADSEIFGWHILVRLFLGQISFHTLGLSDHNSKQIQFNSETDLEEHRSPRSQWLRDQTRNRGQEPIQPMILVWKKKRCAACLLMLKPDLKNTWCDCCRFGIEPEKSIIGKLNHIPILQWFFVHRQMRKLYITVHGWTWIMGARFEEKGCPTIFAFQLPLHLWHTH